MAQEAHRVDDPFVGRLADVLGNLEGKLKAEDAWEIVGVPPGQRNQDHNERLGEAMRELGWKRTRLRSDGKLVYWYVKGEASGWRRIEVDADQQGRVYARYDGDPPF